LHGALADHLLLALAALAIEGAIGYPNALFQWIGHPASWLGAMVGALDRLFNREDWSQRRRRATGVLSVAALAGVSLAAGLLVREALLATSFGFVALAALSSSLLAQRSLYEHVAAVADALDHSLEDGRKAVANIVGRDTSALDEAGVSRAAIESLAENFSDGVVAPVLWLALFGLPGALVYKAINTADSMVGHRSPRHQAYGWASARLDDLLNLPASRLSALLLALAAALRSWTSGAAAVTTAWRSAAAHVSPNAGWPEAAMAGALGLRLGGPRRYRGGVTMGAWLGEGRANASVEDIRKALSLYWLSLALLWLIFILAAFAVHV
jgi:adenosylcobinamide-phosphate synthase